MMWLRCCSVKLDQLPISDDVLKQPMQISPGPRVHTPTQGESIAPFELMTAIADCPELTMDPLAGIEKGAAW
jgi:hypothetical protein